jgi:hypothetical protein
MRVVAVAITVTLIGCSFLSMERVTASDREEGMPTCTQSVGPVIADGLAIIFFSRFLGNDIRGALDDTNTDARRTSHVRDASFVSGIILAYAASGLWGHRVQQRCRRARHAHEERIRDLPARGAP